MSLFKLTTKSIWNRKLTNGLLILSIALSTCLFIGVHKIKLSAKKSFSHSISGTDLIIGARSGDIQLLLYTVFRQGKPIANMSWDSVTNIEKNKNVKWLVPISLGDSHRNYAVLGTKKNYFEHYRYGNKKKLSFQKGQSFNAPFEAVIGSEIAKELRYKINQNILLSHGIAKGNLPVHKNNPFRIVGILKPTGTPVDKTIHVPLEGMVAIHTPGSEQPIDVNKVDLTPKSVTGCLVGLNNKFSIFSVQQTITNWPTEPLMAIIPGVTLSTLWQNISTIDTAFFIITMAVTLIAFIGLLLGLFLSLQQRKNELAILRIMGAHPRDLAIMVILESLILTSLGVTIGLGLTLSIGPVLAPIIEAQSGLILNMVIIHPSEVYFSLGIILFGVMIV